MYKQGKNLNNLYKANFIAGINALHYVTSSFSVSGGLTYNWILNPFYDTKEKSEDIYNFVLSLGLKYSL